MSNQHLFNALAELGIPATQGEMQTVLDAVAKDGGPHVTVCKGCGHLSTTPIKPPALGCCPDSNYIPLQEWIDSAFKRPLKTGRSCPRCKSSEINTKLITHDCHDCGKTWQTETLTAEIWTPAPKPVEWVKAQKVLCAACKGQGLTKLKFSTKVQDCKVCEGQGFHMVNVPAPQIAGNLVEQIVEQSVDLPFGYPTKACEILPKDCPTCKAYGFCIEREI